MEYKTDVLLVDAHAEGVGRGDDLQRPCDEAFLDAAFGGGVETRMEGFTEPSLVLEVLGDVFGAESGSGVDDGGPGEVPSQSLG